MRKPCPVRSVESAPEIWRRLVEDYSAGVWVRKVGSKWSVWIDFQTLSPPNFHKEGESLQAVMAECLFVTECYREGWIED